MESASQSQELLRSASTEVHPQQQQTIVLAFDYSPCYLGNAMVVLIPVAIMFGWNMNLFSLIVLESPFLRGLTSQPIIKLLLALHCGLLVVGPLYMWLTHVVGTIVSVNQVCLCFFVGWSHDFLVMSSSWMLILWMTERAFTINKNRESWHYLKRKFCQAAIAVVGVSIVVTLTGDFVNESTPFGGGRGHDGKYPACLPWIDKEMSIVTPLWYRVHAILFSVLPCQSLLVFMICLVVALCSLSRKVNKLTQNQNLYQTKLIEIRNAVKIKFVYSLVYIAPIFFLTCAPIGLTIYTNSMEGHFRVFSFNKVLYQPGGRSRLFPIQQPSYVGAIIDHGGLIPDRLDVNTSDSSKQPNNTGRGDHGYDDNYNYDYTSFSEKNDNNLFIGRTENVDANATVGTKSHTDTNNKSNNIKSDQTFDSGKDRKSNNIIRRDTKYFLVARSADGTNGKENNNENNKKNNNLNTLENTGFVNDVHNTANSNDAEETISIKDNNNNNSNSNKEHEQRRPLNLGQRSTARTFNKSDRNKQLPLIPPPRRFSVNCTLWMLYYSFSVMIVPILLISEPLFRREFRNTWKKLQTCTCFVGVTQTTSDTENNLSTTEDNTTTTTHVPLIVSSPLQENLHENDNNNDDVNIIEMEPMNADRDPAINTAKN